MSRLKVMHGVSRIRRAKLQSSIDQAVADDIELLAKWSNNETNYVINELLKFALTQEEEFQKYKASLPPSRSRPLASTAKSTSASDPSSKLEPSNSSTTTHA